MVCPPPSISHAATCDSSGENTNKSFYEPVRKDTSVFENNKFENDFESNNENYSEKDYPVSDLVMETSSSRLCSAQLTRKNIASLSL